MHQIVRRTLCIDFQISSVTYYFSFDKELIFIIFGIVKLFWLKCLETYVLHLRFEGIEMLLFSQF